MHSYVEAYKHVYCIRITDIITNPVFKNIALTMTTRKPTITEFSNLNSEMSKIYSRAGYLNKLFMRAISSTQRAELKYCFLFFERLLKCVAERKYP